MGLNGLITKEWKVRLKATPDTHRPAGEWHWGFLPSCGSLGQGEESREDGAPPSSAAPHLLAVLLQALVVFAQRGQVDEGDHVLKAVDPLLAF